MWQKLRNELADQGFELVTVGLDALGADGCREFINAAAPEHPALIDRHHVLANLFGVVNIPMGIWINEEGMIVRPPEAAPAPPSARPQLADMDLSALPERMRDMMTYAVRIPNDAQAYHAALRDWVSHGADSQFALSPAQVIERSQPRNADVSLGHAHFELATQLEIDGHHGAAIEHFREAHRLVPDSWTFRRQAWSLETPADAPMPRYWQGPDPANPEAWPYAGDWLKDIRAAGPENYSVRFKP